MILLLLTIIAMLVIYIFHLSNLIEEVRDSIRSVRDDQHSYDTYLEGMIWGHITNGEVHKTKE